MNTSNTHNTLNQDIMLLKHENIYLKNTIDDLKNTIEYLKNDIIFIKTLITHNNSLHIINTNTNLENINNNELTLNSLQIINTNTNLENNNELPQKQIINSNTSNESKHFDNNELTIKPNSENNNNISILLLKNIKIHYIRLGYNIVSISQPVNISCILGREQIPCNGSENKNRIFMTIINQLREIYERSNYSFQNIYQLYSIQLNKIHNKYNTECNNTILNNYTNDIYPIIDKYNNLYKAIDYINNYDFSFNNFDNIIIFNKPLNYEQLNHMDINLFICNKIKVKLHKYINPSLIINVDPYYDFIKSL